MKIIKPITAKAVVSKTKPKINVRDIYSNVDAVFLRITKDEELLSVTITPIEDKDTKTRGSSMETKVGASKKKSKRGMLHLRRKSVGRTTRGK